jgi:arsenate reductase
MPPPSTSITIQVFGLEKDRSTRAAQRFFKERRVPISFVDLRRRAIAPGELRRFAERLGARALLDETSRAYRASGLGYLRMDDDDVMRRLLAGPVLAPSPARAERERRDRRDGRTDVEGLAGTV